jgi:hypothetical protein
LKSHIYLFTFIFFGILSSQEFGWGENGVPVRQGYHIEWNRAGDVGNDGEMIFAWSDTRTSDRDIYAQKFNTDGDALWGDGIIVVDHEGRQEDPVVVNDGVGGAYIIWSDFRNEPISEGQPYAQHINVDGDLTWDEDGVSLSDDKLQEYSLNMCVDRNGGAYALWRKKNAGHYASFLDKGSSPTSELEVISNEWSHGNPSLESAGDGLV